MEEIVLPPTQKQYECLLLLGRKLKEKLPNEFERLRSTQFNVVRQELNQVLGTNIANDEVCRVCNQFMEILDRL